MSSPSRKCIVFFVTLTTLVAATSCIVCGVLLAFPTEGLLYLYDDGGSYTFYPAVALLATGLAALLLGLLACCGLLNEVKSAIAVFCVGLVGLACVQLAASSLLLSFAYSSEVPTYVNSSLFHELINYNMTTCNNSCRIDTLQIKYKCCGVYSYGDWEEKHPSVFNSSSLLAPLSCCNRSISSKDSHSGTSIHQWLWRQQQQQDYTHTHTRDQNQILQRTLASTDTHTNTKTHTQVTHTHTQVEVDSGHRCTENATNIYDEGCKPKVVQVIRMVSVTIFGVIAATAFLELATSCLSCYGIFLIKKYEMYEVL